MSAEEEEAQAQSTVSNAEAVVVAGSGIACRDRGQGSGGRRVCVRWMETEPWWQHLVALQVIKDVRWFENEFDWL